MSAALASPACPGAAAITGAQATPSGAQVISVLAKLGPHFPQPLASVERVCILQQASPPHPLSGLKMSTGPPGRRVDSRRTCPGPSGSGCRDSVVGGGPQGPIPSQGTPKPADVALSCGCCLPPALLAPSCPQRSAPGWPAGSGPNRHHASLKKDGGSKLVRPPCPEAPPRR